MDTQNKGLEMVVPFKYGHLGIYVEFLGCNRAAAAGRNQASFQQYGHFLAPRRTLWVVSH